MSFTELWLIQSNQIQHQNTINDATKIVKEIFREMENMPNKPIYPTDLEAKLLNKIRNIPQRTP